MSFKYILLLLMIFIVFLTVLIGDLPDNNLHIIACDVGQGDAILITHKNVQILTDGGPNNKVIGCLSKYMPFWDRKINLVISTHPDADHSTGLVEVLKRYNVANVLINPINSGTNIMQVLENTVGSRDVNVLLPHENPHIGLGLIYLDILNPSQIQISKLTKKADESKLGFYTPVEATNLYSITYKLSFNGFSGLFTGDIDQTVSERLAKENSYIHVDYIKIPHHGSKNGITEDLLVSAKPKVAVISVGKNNYGHPNAQIMEMLKKYGIKAFRTDETGDFEIMTNGDSLWVNK